MPMIRWWNAGRYERECAAEALNLHPLGMLWARTRAGVLVWIPDNSAVVHTVTMRSGVAYL